MGANSLLFKTTTNRLLDVLAKHGRVGAPIGAEEHLASQLGVSRSTVRKAIHHLAEKGVIELNGRRKSLRRNPQRQDYFALKGHEAAKSDVAEGFILKKLSLGELQPGDAFSELELARESGCSTVTIREVLLRISRLGLIEKRPRRQWRVIDFSADMIDELIEMREILERFALERILKLDRDHLVFQKLEQLLEEHQAFLNAKRPRLAQFPDLDQRLHSTFLDACKNRYVDSFYTMCAFLIYYQLRPRKLGRKRANIAINEHIALLEALLAKDQQAAIARLRRHMESAKTFLKLAAGIDEVNEAPPEP